MQELLFGPLLLTWGPPILAFIKQHPWQVFAAVLVFVLLMDLMLSKRRSRGGDGGDLSILDFGDGDGGGDGGGD
jgi:hypothetical protein